MGCVGGLVFSPKFFLALRAWGLGVVGLGVVVFVLCGAFFVSGSCGCGDGFSAPARGCAEA